jgi:hypothetical protein
MGKEESNKFLPINTGISHTKNSDDNLGLYLLILRQQSRHLVPVPYYNIICINCTGPGAVLLQALPVQTYNLTYFTDGGSGSGSKSKLNVYVNLDPHIPLRNNNKKDLEMLPIHLKLCTGIKTFQERFFNTRIVGFNFLTLLAQYYVKYHTFCQVGVFDSSKIRDI